MRLMLMYDLAMDDQESLKAYQKFRKLIMSKGFFMIQYSIYCKPLSSPTKINPEIEYIRKRVPKNGNIRIFYITEKQYQKMEILRGGKGINEIINTTSRRVKITYDEK